MESRSLIFNWHFGASWCGCWLKWSRVNSRSTMQMHDFELSQGRFARNFCVCGSMLWVRFFHLRFFSLIRDHVNAPMLRCIRHIPDAWCWPRSRNSSNAAEECRIEFQFDCSSQSRFARHSRFNRGQTLSILFDIKHFNWHQLLCARALSTKTLNFPFLPILCALRGARSLRQCHCVLSNIKNLDSLISVLVLLSDALPSRWAWAHAVDLACVFFSRCFVFRFGK